MKLPFPPFPHRFRWLARVALVAALGWANPLRAQQLTAADTAALASSLAAARHAYAQALGTESVLYNGAEYVDYTPPGTSGHQFFLSPDPQKGAVAYRDGYFTGVPLRYDLVRDQPVLLYPGQAVAVALPTDKVAGFALGEHQFVRVTGDTLTAGTLRRGYYELLVEGPVRLLARHSKALHQAMINQVLGQEYRQVDQLYVATPAGAAEVTNLKKLLAQLPAHQAETQRYARQQRLKFKAATRATDATQLLRYYYTLQP